MSTSSISGYQDTELSPYFFQYDATIFGRDNTRQKIVEMLSFNLILNLFFRTIGVFFVSKSGLSDWTFETSINNSGCKYIELKQ